MSFRFSIFLICGLLISISASFAQQSGDQPIVIVVTSAEGTADYGAEFNKWADRWADAAKRGIAQFIQIGKEESTESMPDKQRLKDLLDKQSKDSAQPLWLVLIGHGTFDGREAKFNLRGPDITNQELTDWLKPFTRPLVVADCSSASSPFLNKLSGKNRIIITATRSGSEINYARFGDYLSSAIADPAADLDKDGQTSLLEAFLAASHQVEEFYKQNSRLATEHALLDDNGDGQGIASSFFQGLRATRAARDGAPLDGPRARQLHLVLSASEQAMSPELRARRDEIEMNIEALRGRKALMAEADYYVKLEEHLIQLATLYQQAGPTTQAQ